MPRLIEKTRPALAVLDLVLPGTDGIELMRTLPGLAGMPVIFVSAYGEGDTVARALEAGVADYIVKPFSPAELAVRVALALCRHSPPAPFRAASSPSTGRSGGERSLAARCASRRPSTGYWTRCRSTRGAWPPTRR